MASPSQTSGLVELRYNIILLSISPEVLIKCWISLMLLLTYATLYPQLLFLPSIEETLDLATVLVHIAGSNTSLPVPLRSPLPPMWGRVAGEAMHCVFRLNAASLCRSKLSRMEP